MNLNTLLNVARSFRTLVLSAVTLTGVGATQAANFFDDTVEGINLGNASGGYTGGHKNWAIFALSGGVTITDPTTGGGYDVLGNVGIGGSGGLTLSLATIKGTVYMNGTPNNSGGTITGGYNSTLSNPGGYISQGVLDVGNSNTSGSAAYVAANLAPSTSGLTLGGGVSGSIYGSNYTSALTLNNTGGSITAQAAGTYVLNLTDLILSGVGANLMLNGNGTAGAVNYVVNVNRYMSLSSQASITLGGGLSAENVLFNVKSNSTQYDVTLSGGAVVNGIIMAPTRNVKETGGSVVYGQVIAKGVSLSGQSKVINPTVSQ